MKRLCLPSDLQAQIRQQCEDSYPHEACGLLIGRHDASGRACVTNIIPSPNLSDHPEKNFEIDPALIIQYQKKCREGGIEIIGHYHSHPDGQAVPSIHDQSQNYDRDLIWVIVHVTAAGALAMNGFATDPQSGQLAAIPLDPEAQH